MSNRNDAGCFCSLWLFVLIINLTLGAFCFDYSLDTIFGKDIAWGWDALGGLVLGEVTIPCAIICVIVLEVAGVDTPFIGR